MEETNSNDTKFWVALSRIPQLGTVKFRRLESYFGKLENAWQAGFKELKAAGIEDRPAHEIVAARNNTSPDDEMAALERAGVTAVTWNDSGYPSRLKEIADPPAVLFYKGTLLVSDDRSVAIVGTISPTTYGREAAAVLSRGLAQAGLTVVSGFGPGYRRRGPPDGFGRAEAAPSPCWLGGWTGCIRETIRSCFSRFRSRAPSSASRHSV